MEKQETISVVFDYTSFLGASCKKKWTFIEAFGSFAPIFSTVWKSNIDDARKPDDRLWDKAINNLSAQSSDESNLISLVNLAKREGIEELRLMMPYELDETQIETIVEHTNAQIRHSAQDEFLIRI
ncbi:transporter [Vibrio algarum]|uniref:Transporter n=1 Tax=Vibrio algarum TaxID=3020714 RepID=A0ABT4YRD2_9VIBR|nr:transporter [Vibrio sp. KJ40-1]MDB1123945.1 transporter [Vibrio sp. KJ40-1]